MNYKKYIPSSKLDTLQQILAETVPISGTIGEQYLIQECNFTDALPDCLVFHENLWHCKTNSILPALISKVTIWPDNQVTGIQRTYLDNDKLANIPCNKMNLGSIRGGSVRVGHQTSTIILTESIEYMLIAYSMTKLWSWSAISGPGLGTVILPPPEIIQKVIICGISIEPSEFAQTAITMLRKSGYNTVYTTMHNLKREAQNEHN